MIRLLQPKDQKKVLNYLYQDLAFNIFLIGDIEAFGMQTSFQRVYGEFDACDHFISVFLRYHDYSLYYSHQRVFNTEYLDVFNQDPFLFISAKTELIELIYPHLHNFQRKDMYFCQNNEVNVQRMDDSRIQILKTVEDAAQLYDFLITIDEFNYATTHSKERFIKEKTTEGRFGLTLFIKENQEIIATAATSAETTKNAMVVAVATSKLHRNQGNCTRIMQRLLDIYINEKKKSLCLSYDNIDAGKIYHKLGFVTIGRWTSCSRINHL